MIQLIPPDRPFADLEAFMRRIERPGNAEVRKVADAIRQGYAENFSREGSAAGGWRALAEATVAERRRLGFPGEHPILRRSGALRASFIQPGATDHVEEFQPVPGGWDLLVGSESEIALFQEFGTSRIPPRPISPLTEAAQERIGAVIDYVIQQMEYQTLGR